MILAESWPKPPVRRVCTASHRSMIGGFRMPAGLVRDARQTRDRMETAALIARSAAMTEQERNQQVADRLCQDFAWDGQMFREGQFVALLDGRIVAVSDNVRSAITALRAAAPDPQRGMVVEIGHPEVDVIR
jgi:hypothetical protein